MKKKNETQSLPYSYLVDNIKLTLIFLVVFNHLIALQLVKVNMISRYIWYGITIFHMPAFIFVSGYLSKHTQSVLKNVKYLLIPYMLGYVLTWYTYTWSGMKMSFDILRPTGSVLWYLLALFTYRVTVEAMGKIRFILPLSIALALWAGTRPEFSTYLSASRIVVFFPFFIAGYFWKAEYTKGLRKFKGKWILLLLSGVMLYIIPNYMIQNEISVAIFRGNHSYQICGLSNQVGILIRGLSYLVSFVLIFALFALIPDRKILVTWIGRNTMGIYLLHYPIMIVLNSLGIWSLMILDGDNVFGFRDLGIAFGVSLVFVLILGSAPVNILYRKLLSLISFILFVKSPSVRDEGLEDEYDDKEDRIVRARKEAIDRLAEETAYKDIQHSLNAQMREVAAQTGTHASNVSFNEDFVRQPESEPGQPAEPKTDLLPENDRRMIFDAGNVPNVDMPIYETRSLQPQQPQKPQEDQGTMFYSDSDYGALKKGPFES